MKWFVGYSTLLMGNIKSKSEDTFLDAFRRNVGIRPTVPFSGVERFLHYPVDVIVCGNSPRNELFRSFITPSDLVNISKKALTLMLERMGTFEISPVHLRKALKSYTTYNFDRLDELDVHNAFDLHDKELSTYLREHVTKYRTPLTDPPYFEWKCVKNLPREDQLILRGAIYEFNNGNVFDLVCTLCNWAEQSKNEDLIEKLVEGSCWGVGVSGILIGKKVKENSEQPNQVKLLIADWCKDQNPEGLMLAWKLAKESGVNANSFIKTLSEFRIKSKFKSLEAVMRTLLF